MKAFGNRAIAASAGTGKTWALSHRYLALMAAGVEPDRICALTFSRKAAGEIFDSIVDRICEAASSDVERAKTRASMADQLRGLDPPAEAAAFVCMLRRLLDAGHRLRIGTLDSFMLGVVRAFPLELGVPPDCRPMDNGGAEATTLRQSLLMKVFDPERRTSGGRGESAAIGAAVLDAFRMATYGQESKSLAKRLDRDIAEYHEAFQRDTGEVWSGGAERIWPASARWWEAVGEDALRVAVGEPYREALRAAWGESRGAQLGDACAKVVDVAAGYRAETAWPRNLSSVFSQLLGAAAGHEPPTLTYYRKDYSLPAALWPPLRAALANMVRVELERALRRTAGLGALLARYDELYREAQRAVGGMTFSDVTRLLCEPGCSPSREPASPGKLYIDYRLDGRLDHWLFDEFQDTSDEQWGAVANLIDEVVQDADRSFVYVGDIKQSIYGWRNGNWRLFDKVRRDCGIADLESLVECHRSRPAITDTVNAVFGGLRHWTPVVGKAGDPEKGPHPDAVAAFVGEQWPTHVSATPAGAGAGFAALLEYVPEDKDEQDGGESEGGEGAGDDAGNAGQYAAIARILSELPLRQARLSVAVLLRSNEQGRSCADTLRRCLPADVPVVHEGVGGIVDNPVVTLLLALVRYAAHPADTQARRHLEMSPLPPDGADGWVALTRVALLRECHEQGYAAALRPWGDRLAEAGAIAPDDAFGRRRLSEFLAAAEAFDAGGSRDPDAFAEFIRACQVKAQAEEGAVRVMTIHQSKGLGFDVVFVPFDSKARSFTNFGQVRLLSGSTCDGEAGAWRWVLRPPRREALQAAGGPPAAALDALRADANFEQLCGLYVALTRAKRAMYMLVPPVGKTSQSVREADLLRQQLGAREDGGEEGGALHGLTLLYACGDAEWHTRVAAPSAAPATSEAPAGLELLPAPGVRFMEPSKEHAIGQAIPAAWLFGEEAGDVPAFGQALHRLFERVEWVEDADVDALVAAWREESDESAVILNDVEKQFRRCLADADVRACLSRPTDAAVSEVWREAPFSFVREGPAGPELVSGRFDRVVLSRAPDGHVVHADIVDFKSNRVKTEAEVAETAAGYTAQMRDYAIAVARLLDLSPVAVRLVLLFTRPVRVWPVAVGEEG